LNPAQPGTKFQGKKKKQQKKTIQRHARPVYAPSKGPLKHPVLVDQPGAMEDGLQYLPGAASAASAASAAKVPQKWVQHLVQRVAAQTLYTGQSKRLQESTTVRQNPAYCIWCISTLT
jgi:hypothetical protein